MGSRRPARLQGLSPGRGAPASTIKVVHRRREPSTDRPEVDPRRPRSRGGDVRSIGASPATTAGRRWPDVSPERGPPLRPSVGRAARRGEILDRRERPLRFAWDWAEDGCPRPVQTRRGMPQGRDRRTHRAQNRIDAHQGHPLDDSRCRARTTRAMPDGPCTRRVEAQEAGSIGDASDATRSGGCREGAGARRVEDAIRRRLRPRREAIGPPRRIELRRGRRGGLCEDPIALDVLKGQSGRRRRGAGSRPA